MTRKLYKSVEEKVYYNVVRGIYDDISGEHYPAGAEKVDLSNWSSETVAHWVRVGVLEVWKPDKGEMSNGPTG